MNRVPSKKPLGIVVVFAALWLGAGGGCSSSSSGNCDDGAGGGFPGGGSCPDAGSGSGEDGCAPQCSGRSCGSDGCGGSCGSCPSGQECGSNGTCGTSTTGGVAPGGACRATSDCVSSKCSTGATCVDWNDGNGSACSCDCSWGTDCESGCCWAVDGGSASACRAGSACSPIGGSCAYQYECLNGNCGSLKSYCYGSDATCGCGCTTNSDCESNCCAPYGSPIEFYACSAAGTSGC
jgi:hypothetical protein